MTSSSAQDAQNFDRVAAQADQLHQQLQTLFRKVVNLSNHIDEAVAGSSTGVDRGLNTRLSEVSSRIGRAATEFANASQAAKAAAARAREDAAREAQSRSRSH